MANKREGWRGGGGEEEQRERKWEGKGSGWEEGGEADGKGDQAVVPSTEVISAKDTDSAQPEGLPWKWQRLRSSSGDPG